jgi:hypothetical protein
VHSYQLLLASLSSQQESEGEDASLEFQKSPEMMK